MEISVAYPAQILARRHAIDMPQCAHDNISFQTSWANGRNGLIELALCHGYYVGRRRHQFMYITSEPIKT